LHGLKSNQSDDARRVRLAHDLREQTRLAAAGIAGHKPGARRPFPQRTPD
jgi:hypothetical protein